MVRSQLEISNGHSLLLRICFFKRCSWNMVDIVMLTQMPFGRGVNATAAGVLWAVGLHGSTLHRWPAGSRPSSHRLGGGAESVKCTGEEWEARPLQPCWAQRERTSLAQELLKRQLRLSYSELVSGLLPSAYPCFSLLSLPSVDPTGTFRKHPSC